MPKGTGGLRRASRIFRTISWLFLIVGGITLTVYVAVHWPEYWAAPAVGSVAVWIGWGILSGYLFGVRRPILAHLKIHSDDAEVIKHPFPARQRVDFQIALDQILDR